MPTRSRLDVFVNPSAWSGRGLARLRHSARFGQPLGAWETRWLLTRSGEELRAQVAASARDPHVARIAVAGGDGTVAMALDTLTRAPRTVPLGILPTGSGNDFAKEAGIGGDVETAMSVLQGSWARPVDVGAVRDTGEVFGCVASVGLDARALEIIHGSSWPRSLVLNIYAAVHSLLTFEPMPVLVTWDGGSYAGGTSATSGFSMR